MILMLFLPLIPAIFAQVVVPISLLPINTLPDSRGNPDMARNVEGQDASSTDLRTEL